MSVHLRVKREGFLRRRHHKGSAAGGPADSPGLARIGRLRIMGRAGGGTDARPPARGRATEGRLADKSTQAILEALRRAAADPTGVPLHSALSAPGLFAATAAARDLARRCVDEGFLRVVRTEHRGKSVEEFCAITDKGLDHLLRQTSPREVLEDLVRALEARRGQ